MRGSILSTAPWMLALLVACGGDPAPDGADTDDDTDTDTDNPTDLPGQDTSAHVEGVVRGPDGAPVEGANIRFCRGPTCRYATTDAAGSYAFPEAVAEWHALEVVPPNDDLAVGFIPIELQTDWSRTIDFTLPALDARSALAASPAEHELGAGLLVTVGAASLEPPLFLDDATSVAGVRVPEAIWPPIDGLGAPIAVWYTDPFDYHATGSAGLGFRIRNDWELLVGGTYEVWVGSYSAAAWVDAGTVTVGADGYLTGAGGLPLLSTVVLVDPT